MISIEVKIKDSSNENEFIFNGKDITFRSPDCGALHLNLTIEEVRAIKFWADLVLENEK